MGRVTPRARRLRRSAAAAALAALSALAFARARAEAGRVGDEEDYRRAACHLLSQGTLSLDPLERERPRPSAYREPLYPLLLAALAVPAPERLCAAPLDPGAPIPARVAWTQWALLAGAAALAGLAAARRVPEPTAWLTAAAIAASPALAAAAATYAVEALAAPLLLAATVALAAALERPLPARAALAGAAAGLVALTRVDWLLVALLGALLLPLAARGGRRRALLALAVFALTALAPLGAWALRNRALPGAPLLVEARSGAVLLIRAELDRALAGRRGLAALAWTPVPALAERALFRPELEPILRPRWKGEEHYFVRARRRWAELLATSAHPAEAGRRAAAEARALFLEAPLGHLASSAAVGWRGLFLERDPEATRGLGLAAVYALALWAAAGWAGLRALARRDLAAALPALVLFAAAAAHALLTENLPRFGQPALPLAVLAAALAVARPALAPPGLAAAPERDTIAG